MRPIKDYNVYQLDDFLLNVGGAATVFCGTLLLIGIYFISQIFMIFVLSGGIACLACGGYIRLKEKRVNGIARSLERVNDIHLNEFVSATGYSVEQILDGIQVINSRGMGFYAVDEKTSRISDMRLTQTVAFSDVCSRCGKEVVEQYSMHSDSVPQCPYCFSPLNMDKWNKLKKETLGLLDNDQALGEQVEGQSQRSFLSSEKDSKPLFNMSVFVILLLLFWPFAVVYMLVSYSASKGNSQQWGKLIQGIRIKRRY